MGIGTSLFMIAVGAILRFAITESIAGIDLQVVGVIFMVIGVLGLVLSLGLMLFSADRHDGSVPRDPRDPRY